jgi:hypothetical protein
VHLIQKIKSNFLLYMLISYLFQYGFLDVREPVTLKFLRLLPNIDEETYKQILCLFDSPQRHLTQTKQNLQHQNFSFYLVSIPSI